MSSKVGLSIPLLLCFAIVGCSTQLGTNSIPNSADIANVQEGVKAFQERNDVYQIQLFFGLSKPDGGVVTLLEWNAFEEDVIATEFYSGFTVLDATGYYQGKQERSKIVTLVVKEAAIEQRLIKIRQIAKVYAAKFGQESVMLTKSAVLEWDFIDATQ